MPLIVNDGRPYRELPNGKLRLATRVGQYYNALKTESARTRLFELERRAVCSPRQFTDACAQAWQVPGLSAHETVDFIEGLVGRR